jgi:hypothetical protein
VDIGPARTVHQRARPRRATGEGKLHLRLDTGRTRDQTARSLLGDVVQQRRLAHARLATYHQRVVFAGANGFDHAVERIAFAATTLELDCAS